MRVTKTNIDGVVIIKPKMFKDNRGYFFESFNEKEFKEKVANIDFVQDNESKSSYGVLRGIHFQVPPYSQSKLVRVVKGKVLDIAVDLRKDSPTYGQWTSVILTSRNHKQFFLPQGMGHAFVVLTKTAVFQYKCDNFYNKDADGGIAWDDKDLNIDWKIPIKDIILSEKDKHHQTFKEFKKNNPFYDCDKFSYKYWKNKILF